MNAIENKAYEMGGNLDAVLIVFMILIRDKLLLDKDIKIDLIGLKIIK